MSDNFTLQVVTTLLTGTAADRTSSETMASACTKACWAQVQLDTAASDVVLLLDLETDPKVLIVVGEAGVSFKLGNTGGTDAIGADPVAVVSNEGDGLGITGIQLSNSSAVTTAVTVMAFE